MPAASAPLRPSASGASSPVRTTSKRSLVIRPLPQQGPQGFPHSSRDEPGFTGHIGDEAGASMLQTFQHPLGVRLLRCSRWPAAVGIDGLEFLGSRRRPTAAHCRHRPGQPRSTPPTPCSHPASSADIRAYGSVGSTAPTIPPAETALATGSALRPRPRHRCAGGPPAALANAARSRRTGAAGR